MNDFRPGTAGGGNVGFAFDACTELDIAVAPRDEVLTREGKMWSDERVSLIRYVLDEWRKLTGSNHQYRVRIRQVNSAHTGLASSASLQLAMWTALNHIFGHVYPDTVLREKIARMYREAEGETTEPAFTTGLSSFLGLYGGFAVVGQDLSPSVHVRIPKWSAAIAVPTDVRSVSFGAVERDALTTRGPQLDERDRARKLAILTDRLVPAVTAQDLVATGRAVTHLQQVGSKLAELEIYGDAVARPLAKLRDTFPCAFMSAVGPGIAVVSDATPDELHSQLREVGVDIIWCGMVNNSGIELAPAVDWD